MSQVPNSKPRRTLAIDVVPPVRTPATSLTCGRQVEAPHSQVTGLLPGPHTAGDTPPRPPLAYLFLLPSFLLSSLPRPLLSSLSFPVLFLFLRSKEPTMPHAAVLPPPEATARSPLLSRFAAPGTTRIQGEADCPLIKMRSARSLPRHIRLPSFTHETMSLRQFFFSLVFSSPLDREAA